MTDKILIDRALAIKLVQMLEAAGHDADEILSALAASPADDVLLEGQKTIAWMRIDSSGNESPSFVFDEPTALMVREAAVWGESYMPLIHRQGALAASPAATANLTSKEDHE